MRIIAFISTLQQGGGAERVFSNIVEKLNAEHDVEVVVQNMGNNPYTFEFQSIRINNLNVKNNKLLFFYLYNYIRNSASFDIALIFGAELSVYIYLVKMILKQRYQIVSRCLNTMSIEYELAEGAFRRYVTGTVVKAFYKKMNMIISQSEGMKRDLIEKYGVSEKSITVINNPLATAFEREMLESEPIAMDKRDNYILFVGRLEKQKGLEMLLKAFARLNDKSIELYLVGDGSKQKELTDLADEYGIANRVHFQGFTTELIPYYRKAKLLALSSYYEGFPNVLIEALACGTPVVAYDLPSGPSEIIENGVNGYLAKYLDVEDLARCMDNALQTGWDRGNIVQTSMKYCQDVIINQYCDALQKIHYQN